MSQNLTDLEKQMLTQIRESCYHDGRHPVGDATWRFEAMDGFPGKTGNGVLSSLVKKGWATSQEEGEDSVVELTQEGFNALPDATEWQAKFDADRAAWDAEKKARHAAETEAS